MDGGRQASYARRARARRQKPLHRRSQPPTSSDRSAAHRMGQGHQHRPDLRGARLLPRARETSSTSSWQSSTHASISITAKTFSPAIEWPRMINRHHFDRVMGLIENRNPKRNRRVWRAAAMPKRSRSSPRVMTRRYARRSCDATRRSSAPCCPLITWRNDR